MSGWDPVRLAIDNAIALWELFGSARGHRVVRRPSFLAVDAGTEQGGLRVIPRRGTVPPEDLEAMLDLVRRQAGPTTIEDLFRNLPLDQLDGHRRSPVGDRVLTRLDVPVMVRPPGRVTGAATIRATDRTPGQDAAPVEVVRVDDEESLAGVERMVAEEFPVPAFLPYRRGVMFPPSLLSSTGMEFFAAMDAGRPVAGCLTVVSAGTAGLYWVATSRAHRRRGIGRALLSTVLSRVGDLPVTLAATEAGEPLYRALGFRTVAEATWWRITDRSAG